VKKLLFLFLLFNPLTIELLYAQPAGGFQRVNFKQAVTYIPADSVFGLNIRFRMQNRAVYNTISETDLNPGSIEARVRRLRLRFEGFMYSTKLTYLIQLSFSRGDMDWEQPNFSTINTSPNIVRDAAVYYRPVPNLVLIFGQTKLPGNRQRVVSSGELQFIDRSIVNAGFNIDRDFGFQAHYYNQIGNAALVLKGALTTGDGRNVNFTNAGLSYTGRVEFLPFGPFSNFGDYFEGDLVREENIKVSLAGGMNRNDGARRTGGQIGLDLYEPRGMETYIFDGLVKYQGWALYAEYMGRSASNPISQSPATGDIRYILTGHGQNYQLSYNFKNNVELAARYAFIVPENKIATMANQEDTYIVGITKYLRTHRLKLQANVGYHTRQVLPQADVRGSFNAGVQIELGI
jgi:phosphate-selective porin OprO and OprP